MTLLTELRTLKYADNSYYDCIKDCYYNGETVEIELMEHLMNVDWQGKPTSRWKLNERLCKILGIDDYTFDFCNDCDDIFYNDEMNSCYDGDHYVCNGCRDNYRYSEYRDTYVSEDDYYEEQEENEDYRDEGVYEYCYDVMDRLSHTSTEDDKLQPDTPYYGIELEVEKRSNADENTASNIADCFRYEDKEFALLKSDGSLSNGFEIVSCPATINAHRKYWDKFFTSDVIKEVKSWNTDTTGMHIHISRTALTQLQIGKILVFINDEKNSEFVNHIAGRSSDQWAKKSNKKISDCVQSSDKYEAVNTAHRHTIELRIFKGNLARLGFYRVLEFVDALVHFSKHTSLTRLSYKDFIKYMEQPHVRSQYPIFYGWLSRKSYCIGKPSRKVDWTDEQSNLKEIA